MQGIFLSSRTRCRRCEGSLAFARLGGDSSLLYVSFRMTHLSFRVRLSGRRGIFDFLLFEILRCSAPQNESVPKLFSRRKEVTKKGRPPVIGNSCLSLHSPAGLRNSLCSNSPLFFIFSFALASPIKVGIFPPRYYQPLRVKAIARRGIF